MVGDTTVMIDDVHYEIVEDYRDGFNIEALNERYNDIYERYDYIVGDWGHEENYVWKGFFKHSLALRPWYRLFTRIFIRILQFWMPIFHYWKEIRGAT